MRPAPPSAPLPDAPAVDLLIVGALSIDRFADGSTAAGGSAVHATRAAAALGARVAVVTVAGAEPVARQALADLSRIAQVRARRSSATLSYALDEVGSARRLTLLEPAPALIVPELALRPRAVLYAPVAAEFGAGLAGQQYARALRVGILQGWLRDLHRGQPVSALPLATLPEALITELSEFDALVTSTEDLGADPGTPAKQLARLRARFGPRPLLVVTDGERGAWFRDAHAVERVAPPSVVSGGLAIGAGDAFAAALSLALADGSRGRASVIQATEGVVSALQA